MKRRSFIATVGLSALSALSAGCLRQLESGDSTTSAGPSTSGTGPDSNRTTTPTKRVPEGISKEWSFNGVGAFPRMRGGRLYATGSGHTYCIDTSGNREWQFPNGGGDYYGLATTDSRVVVPLRDGTIYGLERGDGSVAWESAAPEGGECWSTPLVVGGVAIVLTEDPFGCLALDPASGDRVWFDEERGYGAPAGPARIPGTATTEPPRAYLRGSDAVYRVKPESGDVEAEFPFQPASPPRIHGDTLYAGSEQGILRSYEAADAVPKWEFETYGEITTRPLATDGVVVFGSNDNSVYGVSTDGEEVWRQQTGGEVHGYPTLYGQVVYVTSTDGKLYALDPESGTKHLETPIDATQYTVPIIQDDRLYRVNGADLEAYSLEVSTDA